MLSLYIVSGKVTDVKKKRFYKYGRNLHHKPELIIEPVLIMAYNNREMKRIILPSLLACLLAATASLSCSMEPGLYGETVRSPVQGTLYIELPETVPNDFQVSSLRGSVQIMIGNNKQTILPSLIEYDRVEHQLEIPLNVEANFEGVAVLTGVSHLSYVPQDPWEETGTDDPAEEDAEEIPISWAGYLITSLTKDRINKINDTDNNGIVSHLEETTMPFIPAARFYSDSLETTPVQVQNTPVIESFSSTPQFSTPDLSIRLSGTISSLDWGLVYVRVNNQYRWIETVQNPVEPDSVNFPESEEDPVRVTLKPGINEIQLFAVNSHGVSFSETATVTCTAPLHEERENLLVTLTWDTVADLDLHTWYYPPESKEASWHNSYFQPYAPATDEIKNLDADNQTGFGPEHFTLLGALDGYYIIAVNAYSLGGMPTANAFVSIETNERLYSLGPFHITAESPEEYPVNSNPSWRRIADIQITEGVAKICEPDLSRDPPNLVDPTTAATASIRSIKHMLKFR